MPFGIVACTFSDNISRNSRILTSIYQSRPDSGRHICFYDKKPTRKPKIFTEDQMASRQFGGWKQVTTIVVALDLVATPRVQTALDRCLSFNTNHPGENLVHKHESMKFDLLGERSATK